MLYWGIGQRIRQDILKEKRAPYVKEIVAALGENWNPSSEGALVKKICTAWSNLLRFFLMKRLSLLWGDIWAGLILSP